MADEALDITPEEWHKIAWTDDPPDLAEDSRRVLEQYSHIPADQVIDHVTKIRAKAFSIFPYPCIGRWRFLNLALGRHPQYEEVKRRMLSGNETFLDLGCAFAQDIRRLVADGVDSSRCYGSDLRLEFLDLGYDLFRDKESLKATFIAADIFEENSALSQLYGKINIINSSSFFHLFSWAEQKQVAHQCLKLFTGQKGDFLVGRQVGNENAGEFASRAGRGLRFRHNIATWERMWKEVGEEAGAEFEVEAKFIDMKGVMPGVGLATGREEGTQMMLFSVRRV